MEQGHAGQRRGLKGSSQPYGWISTLHLAHRHRGDANPVRQLLQSPAALTSRKLDMSAEQLGCLKGERERV